MSKEEIRALYKQGDLSKADTDELKRQTKLFLDYAKKENSGMQKSGCLPSNSILYISPSQKHRCTGQPSYCTEEHRLSGLPGKFMLIRCKTCQKLFVRSSDIPAVRNVKRTGKFPYSVKTDYFPARPVRTMPEKK